MAEDSFILYDQFEEINSVDPEFYIKYDVKRGLRNADGTGVVTGLTNVANVHGYYIEDGEKIADEGHLRYRGYDLFDLLKDTTPERRFIFEEIAYLLLTAQLPTQAQLDDFVEHIDSQRELPDGFTASIFFAEKAPSVMNLLSRVILNEYACDPIAEDRSYKHEVDVALSLISKLPRAAVLSHYAIDHRFNGGSLIIHPFIKGQSTAETILSMLRPDRKFTQIEAQMLDIMLALHMEHGGGNNSAFTTHVLSSADTDAYSAYSAAIGSLKGYRHGGANFKVRAQQKDIEENVADWTNDDEVASYLEKIIRKEAFDGSGLVYGMGHAVYTKSDPRAVICRHFAHELAKGTEYEAELNLLEMVERITPDVFAKVKGSSKELCANIDMYSGLVYTMLGIPEDLFTPLFACGRFPGWVAHRFEEIVAGKRIIRPAYKSTVKKNREYKPIDQR